MKSSSAPGVYCPVVTPFDTHLTVQPEKWIQQCRWLLGQQVGLAIFGTNSEANSLSVGEKCDLLDALGDSGIDPNWLLPGTGCCALPDSVRLTTHAVSKGCRGVLMLPPFYYKGVSDRGLFASFSEVVERVGDANLRIYLYHIPPVAGVGLSLDLIDQLLHRYPGVFAGIKDSSGDWSNTQAMLDRQWDDFAVFAGSETFLLQTLRGGGAGCISATANVNPGAIARLHAGFEAPDAEAAQQALNAVRETVLQFPMIPALKAIVAHYSSDPDWATVRPPLEQLDSGSRQQLLNTLDTMGFSMPGLGRRQADTSA